MGEKTRETLKLQFDKRLRLEFHGAKITSDAGLLAFRELDGVLGLMEMVPTYLQEGFQHLKVVAKDEHIRPAVAAFAISEGLNPDFPYQTGCIGIFLW